MSWLLEHVQIALAIAVMIAAWLKKLRDASAKRNAKADRPPARANEPARNPAFDSEAAERTRKIQEEIRRKIEERRRSLAPPTGRPPDLPRAPYDPFTPESLQRQNPAEIPSPPEPSRVAADRALELARKLDAAKQREEKRKAKAKAHEDTISIKVAPIALIPSTGPLLPAHPLRETLTDPDEVRRAIVLSEILQPPLALRNA